MSNEATTQSQNVEFSLNESIDITCINRVYEDLKDLLRVSTEITVDAGNVKRIDTAGLQLLCCWFLETKKKDINVTWQNTEGTFHESARLLGLAEVLEI